MRKLLAGIFLVASMQPVYVQSQTYPVVQEKCATDHSLRYRIQHDQGLQQRIEDAEQRAKSSTSNSMRNLRHGLLTIPVVFHVVYNPATAGANIPDSLIHSQVQVLNEDFSRTNANAVLTRSVFDSIAVDFGVQFCLATVDPNGNPTTGINRISSTTSHTLSPFNNSVKSSATGGADPWPTDQYLNIWVCDMSFLGSPFVLGYAQFPGDDPLTDGVVIQYEYIGVTNSTTTAPSNLGRTTTHEVGHWLGLRHVWGDGGCSADDLVDDTPWAGGQSNFNCDLTANTCDDTFNPFWAGTNPPDMVENFMDYSADACMNMFSRGQADRAWSFLATERIGLFSSNGCGVPELNAYTTVMHNPCPGALGGIAIATPVSGTPPYTFLWDDPNSQTDSIAVYLNAGTYHCTVTDASMTSIVLTVYVYDPYLLQVTGSTTVNATCGTCADGSLTVNAIGGSQPYSYSIDGGTPQTSATFSGLNPGTYSVAVTDVCGILQTISVTIGNSVGIEDRYSAAEWELYPNPVSDIIRFDFKSAGTAREIQIITITGQVVDSFQTSESGLNRTISHLEPGLYFVTVKQNGKSTQRKLIVQ